MLEWQKLYKPPCHFRIRNIWFDLYLLQTSYTDHTAIYTSVNVSNPERKWSVLMFVLYLGITILVNGIGRPRFDHSHLSCIKKVSLIPWQTLNWQFRRLCLRIGQIQESPGKSCPSLCFCFGFYLEAKRDKVDSYFVNWPGALEDAPQPYQKPENLLVLILILNWPWVYGLPMHEEEGHLRQSIHFSFVFSGTCFCVCLCILFVLFVLLYKFFFDKRTTGPGPKPF